MSGWLWVLSLHQIFIVRYSYVCLAVVPTRCAGLSGPLPHKYDIHVHPADKRIATVFKSVYRNMSIQVWSVGDAPT